MDNLAQGKYLNLLLYLEGVLVPVISARINQRVGGIATANIDIIPTATALNIHEHRSGTTKRRHMFLKM